MSETAVTAADAAMAHEGEIDIQRDQCSGWDFEIQEGAIDFT